MGGNLPGTLTTRAGPDQASVSALVLALLLVTSMVGAPSAVGQGPGGPDGGVPSTLTVYAVDPSKQPVPEIHVTITDGGDVVAEGDTDSLGAFAAPVGDGTYEVTIEATGYDDPTETVQVRDTTALMVHLTPGKGEAVRKADFVVNTQDLKTGCSVDARYQLEALGGPDFSESGHTGSEGITGTRIPLSTRGPEVVPTPYALTVEKEGYTTLDEVRRVDNHTTAWVRLDPQEGNLEVSVTAEVAGETVPADDAAVTVEGRCPNGDSVALPARTTQTDADGVATFEGLPPADYRITVSKLGYENMTLEVPLDPGESASHDAHLELSNPASISLRTLDYLTFPGREPTAIDLPGVEVTIQERGGDREWNRTTDEAGEATLEDMPPGSYLLTFEKDDQTNHGVKVGWEDEREHVSLGAGEEATLEIELLRDRRRIEAEVENLSARLQKRDSWRPVEDVYRPARHTTLPLVHLESCARFQVTTDEHGFFHRMLPTGLYLLPPMEGSRSGEKLASTPTGSDSESPRTFDVTVRPWAEKYPGEAMEEWGPSDCGSEAPPSPPTDSGQILLGKRESPAEKTERVVLGPELARVRIVAEWNDEGFVDPLTAELADCHWNWCSERLSVPFAEVTLTDAEGYTFEATASPGGVVYFPRVHPGEAEVTVRKKGYETLTQTIDVSRKWWSPGPDTRQPGIWDNPWDLDRFTSWGKNWYRFDLNASQSTGLTLSVKAWKRDRYDPENGEYVVGNATVKLVSESPFTDDLTLWGNERKTLWRDPKTDSMAVEYRGLPAGQYHLFTATGPHVNDDFDDGVVYVTDREFRSRTVNLGQASETYHFGADRPDEDKEAEGTSAAVPTVPLDLIFYDGLTGEPVEGATARITVGNRDVHVETGADGMPTTRPRLDVGGMDGRALVLAGSGEEIEVQNVEVQGPGDLSGPLGEVEVQGREIYLEPNYWIQLKGRVVDQETGDPISALLEVDSVVGDSEADGTNSDDEYQLKWDVARNPPDAEKTKVRVEAEGYETKTISISHPPAPPPDQDTLTKRRDVELSPLAKPEAKVEDPFRGVLLEGVSVPFPWNVTFTEWPVNTSGPGSADVVEEIRWYVALEGSPRLVDTTDVQITPEEIRKQGGVTRSTTLDPANLSTDLQPGEARDVTDFFVRIVTRQQGEIRYPEEADEQDPYETGVVNDEETPAQIAAMPPWMEKTYELARQLEYAEESLFGDKASHYKEMIRRESGALLEAFVTGFFDAPRVIFEAKKNGTGADYEIGYDLQIGMDVSLKGPAKKLGEKIGLPSIGIPSLDIGTVTGTLIGGEGRWTSEAEFSEGISVPSFITSLVPGLAGAEIGGTYSQEGHGNVPGEKSTFNSDRTLEGTATLSPVELLAWFHGKFSSTGESPSPDDAPSPAEDGDDPLVEASADAGLPIGFEFDFTSHSEDIEGPPLLQSKAPVVVNGGGGRVTEDAFTINGTVMVSADVSAGDQSVLDIKSDIGTALEMAGGTAALTYAYWTSDSPNAGKEAHKAFQRAVQAEDWMTWVQENSVDGFTLKFKNFSTDSTVDRPGKKRPVTCPFGFTEVEGAFLALRGGKFQMGGMDLTQLSEKINNNPEVLRAFPIGPVGLCSGSPSEVTYTERGSPSLQRDRYWTGFGGYGDRHPWGGNGTLVQASWPYARPAAAADGGAVTIFVDRDPGGDTPYPGGVTIRRFTGTAQNLKDLPLPIDDRGFGPSVVAEDGEKALAFTRFAPEAEGVPYFHTGDIHFTVDDPGWQDPVQVTDNDRVDTAVDVVPVAGGYLLAWKSAPPITDTSGIGGELRYAFVADRTVEETGALPATGPLGPPSLAPTGDGAVVAYARASDGDEEATIHYATIERGGTSTEEDLGTGASVDAAPLDADRAMVAVGGADGIRYAILEDGTVADSGQVAAQAGREVELVDGPGTGAVLVWAGEEGARAAAYNGTWGAPTTVRSEGHLAGLSAAVEEESGILYLASKKARSPTPLIGDEPVGLAVDTVPLSHLLAGYGTPGNGTTNLTQINLTDLPVDMEALQSTFDRLEGDVRERIAGEDVNVRVTTAEGDHVVVGVHMDGQTIEEIGPPHDEPTLVVETDAETIEAGDDSVAPAQAIGNALERGDIRFTGGEETDRVRNEVLDRAGRVVAGFQDNPLDVGEGEVRDVTLAGQDVTVRGTDLGYAVVQPVDPADDGGDPVTGGGPADGPGDDGAPGDEEETSTDDETGDESAPDESTDDESSETETDDGAGSGDESSTDETTGEEEAPTDTEETPEDATEDGTEDGDGPGRAGGGGGGGGWSPPNANRPDEDGGGDDPSAEAAPDPDDELPVVDRDGVTKGYTTPAVQALAHTDLEDLSPSAGVYQGPDGPVLDLGSSAQEYRSRAEGERRRVEAGALAAPLEARWFPDHEVTAHRFTDVNRAPCGADEPGPRVVETVAGDDGGLLLEGRHVDGERKLLLRALGGGGPAVLGACVDGGRDVRVDYTLEGDRVVATSFEQAVDDPPGPDRILRFLWDSDEGTVELQTGPEGDRTTVATREPPATLDAFLDWAEAST